MTKELLEWLRRFMDKEVEEAERIAWGKVCEGESMLAPAVNSLAVGQEMEKQLFTSFNREKMK